MNTPPKSRRPLAFALLLTCAAVHHVSAVVWFWDPNGLSAPTSGTWDTSTTQWATNSTLTATPVAWQTTNAAGFPAGTSGISALTVGVNSTIGFAGIFNGLTATIGVTNLTINGNGTLSLNAGLQGFSTGSSTYNTIIRVPIIGAGGIQNQAGGSLFLGATNGYTGGFTFGTSSGLNINNSYVFGTGMVTNGNGTIILAIVATDPPGNPFASGPITITNRWQTFGGTHTEIMVGLIGSPVTFSGPFELRGAAGTITTLDMRNTNWYISGPISGASDLRKINASGTLILSGANTYSGRTIIDGGTIRLGASDVIPDTSVVTNGVSGVIFDLNGFNETVKSVQGGAGTIAVGAGTLTLANPVSETYSSVFSGSGKIIKNGSGTNIFSGSSTGWSGETVVNAGVLGIGGNNSVGVGSRVSMNGGKLSNNGTGGRALPATLVISNSFTLDDTLTTPTVPGQISFTNIILKANNPTFTVNAAGSYIFPNLNGGTWNEDAPGRGWTKSGNGQVTLNTENTYSGNTILGQGVISINGATTNNFGAGAGTIIFAGGNLLTTADRGTSFQNIRNPLSLTANSELQTATTTGTRNLTFGGVWTTTAGTLTIHNTQATVGPGTFNVRFTNAFTFTQPISFVIDTAGNFVNLDIWNTLGGEQIYNGVISGPGSIKRSITSANTGGKVTFTAQNTFSGGTSMNDGEIGLGSDCTGASDAPTAGPLGTAAVTVGNDAGKLSAVTSARNLFNHFVFTTGGRHLTMTGTNDLTLSGNLDFGTFGVGITNNNTGVSTITGVISNGSLTNDGPAKLILTGANTYTGATTIRGVLGLSGGGSISSSTNIVLGNGTFDVADVSPYTLASGQILKGNGGINGTIVIGNGATVAPGTSVGTMYFTNPPTLSGTTLMELNRTNLPNADKLTVVPGSGTLTFGGVLSVVNIGPPIQNNDTFDLFDADGFAGAFTATNLPSVPGLTWNTSQLGVNGSITAVCDGTLAANAGVNQTTCGGTGVVLGGSPTATGGSGTYVYLWSPTTGLNSATVANPIASPTTTTIYSVTVTDSAGCIASSGNVTVTVDNTGPAISAGPASTAVCEGSAAIFSVTASAPGALSYSWSKSSNGGWGSAWATTGSGTTFRASATDNDFGDPACSSLSSALDINSPSGNALGMYGGTTGDEVATRSFAALSAGQAVSVDMDNGNVDNGAKVGFSLQSSGGADVVQFYFLGGLSNYKYNDGTEWDSGIGFQRTGLRVQVVLNSATTYHLIVTPCGGSATHFYGTNAGTIAKLKLFNQNTSGGNDHNVYFNNFIVGGYTDNADNYSGDYAGLDKGDVPIIAGNGGSTYTTPAATLADNGSQYKVVVSSCSGSVVSSNATLTVNARPTSVVTGTTTNCAGSPTLISAALTGTQPWTVYWSDGVTQSGVTTSPATRSVSPTVDTTYTVTNLTDANCTAQTGDRTGNAVITVNTITANTTVYDRPSGTSIKIFLSNLLTNASDTFNQTITFLGAGSDGSNLTSTNSAALSTNATFIGYPANAPNVADSFKYKITDAQGCTTLGTILINVVAYPGGLAQSIDTSGGTVTVSFSAIPTYQYVVERAADASFTIDQTNLSTNVAPANGQFSVTDTSPPQPTGFYRLRYSP